MEAQEVHHARDVFLNAAKTLLMAVILIAILWLVVAGVPGTRSLVRWGDTVISVTTIPDSSEAK